MKRVHFRDPAGTVRIGAWHDDGTPAGDDVEVHVEGVGTLRHGVSAP